MSTPELTMRRSNRNLEEGWGTDRVVLGFYDE